MNKVLFLLLSCLSLTIYPMNQKKSFKDAIQNGEYGHSDIPANHLSVRHAGITHIEFPLFPKNHIFKNITHITVTHCKIKEIAICRFFEALPKLKNLNIPRNNTEILDLTGLKSNVVIDASLNNINKVILPYALHRCINTEIDLSYNSLGVHAIAKIQEALKSKETVPDEDMLRSVASLLSVSHAPVIRVDNQQ